MTTRSRAQRVPLFVTAVIAAGVLALTGCSEAQDAVEQAAGGIATSAASKAAAAAQSVAKQQLCRIASDGQISASESQQLNNAISAAEAAGVAASLTDAARQVANSNGTIPADAMVEVKKQCGTS